MLISKLSGFHRLELGWNALSDGRSVFIKSLHAYCWVVSVLAILDIREGLCNTSLCR